MYTTYMRKTEYYKLYAGIGNQLFQYAHGKYLEQQGIRVRFILNRDFSQKPFMDIPELFCVDESCICVPRTAFGLAAAKVRAKYISRSWHTGFYQDYEFASALGESFAFKGAARFCKTEAARRILSSNAVSLHIRGGDYLREDEEAEFGGICTAEYYQKAVEKITQSMNDPVFFIFTNDAPYAKRIVSNLDGTFVFLQEYSGCDSADATYKNDPSFDLYLQTLCKANIIANSTYSWWGAFLNKTPHKIVISPNAWHNKNEKLIDSLVPVESGWSRIK